MTNYDNVPGKAGAILRVASRCGLAIRMTQAGDIKGWIIGTFEDSIYLYWGPSKVASGRTNVYRAGKRTALVAMTGSEAQAWVRTRRTCETYPVEG